MIKSIVKKYALPILTSFGVGVGVSESELLGKTIGFIDNRYAAIDHVHVQPQNQNNDIIKIEEEPMYITGLRELILENCNH